MGRASLTSASPHSPPASTHSTKPGDASTHRRRCRVHPQPHSEYDKADSDPLNAMQPTLIPLELDDGTIIHIQAESGGGVPTRDLGTAQEALKQSFKGVHTLVRGYTAYTINAFKNLGSGNITEVNLEFGSASAPKPACPTSPPAPPTAMSKSASNASFLRAEGHYSPDRPRFRSSRSWPGGKSTNTRSPASTPSKICTSWPTWDPRLTG